MTDYPNSNAEAPEARSEEMRGDDSIDITGETQTPQVASPVAADPDNDPFDTLKALALRNGAALDAVLDRFRDYPDSEKMPGPILGFLDETRRRFHTLSTLPDQSTVEDDEA